MIIETERNSGESKGQHIKRMFLDNLPEHDRGNWAVTVRKDVSGLTKIRIQRKLKPRVAGSTSAEDS